MPPLYINSQASVLLEFSMDGSNVDIVWWKTDLPFVMTCAAREGGGVGGE